MNRIFTGDSFKVLTSLKRESVQSCVTSPPYFRLRDYGHKGQIGIEETPEAYVAKLVALFREVRRVLRDDGTLFLNLGDSYGKGKQLLGVPWRAAFALQADGWILRQGIIWHKTNAMPESATDRCNTVHEYIFLLSKSPRYYFDHKAIKEPLSPNSDVAYRMKLRAGKQYDLKTAYKKNFPATFDLTARNRRSVWTIPTKPYPGAHNAPFPEALVKPCILAGAPIGGVVLDPFLGSGTTAAVAKKLGRQYIGIDLNKSYVKLAQQRIASVLPPQQTLMAAE